MSSYGALAGSYDELTRDIDYGATLRYLQRLLARTGKSAHSVLDLACGTGTLARLLAEQGYQVIGADASEEMLTVASEKIMDLEENRPFFIRQRMERLSLPEKVDWVVCCLDSLNYLMNPADCKRTFERVYEVLKPGGAFIFDINTPYKLRGLDGQIFLDETDDTYCVWRAEFAENAIFYGMDLFRRNGRHWERSFEEHREYAYDPAQLEQWLRETGFGRVEQFGDQTFLPPSETERRIYFLCSKESL